MKVRDVMVQDVLTVGPETSLKDVAAALSGRGISGLPVVDSAGFVIGVVSEADILVKERTPAPRRSGIMGWLAGPPEPAELAKLDARTAGEAMTSPVLTISPGESVARAAALMVEEGVNRLPVVDGDRLVGIVTRADLVRAFTRDDDAIAREISEDVVLRKFWTAPENVSVSVQHGEVTLGGEVESRSVAELMAAFVGRVPGVVSVDASQLSWRQDDRA
ncbi:MAG: CBS domain-containing protein [Thermoleophilia bacterium]|nr:CBS domain-containing protein [Thermoleophilia bacterium]